MAISGAIAIGASALSTGYAVYAGEKANSLQRIGRRRQEAAQKEAIRIQLIERQRSERAIADANKPSPSASLNENPIDAATTDLTGGIDRDRLRLMRSSRLGG